MLCFCFLLAAAVATGQKKSIVDLIKSESSTGIKLNGKDIIKVYKGTFKQDLSFLSSDSAYFYPKDNAFDAFGHVNINQGDTLNIYSDKLNYNGNTKIAILTDNVRMIDKDATLTTNHLVYNTATRIGTYTDGGKLVNKENTLLSKNGYYFAFTRDSYFRYNVSLQTPDALVITDTMRYNTGTRISYFYGPTNIYGTKSDKKKDTVKNKDTLYTENGTYSTITEQAAFGKNNLYHSGTRSLKGDSLFYDKLKEYGRAVKHVTFEDKEQKTIIKGDLGTYFKPTELTIVTEDPYVVMVTEKRDSTDADSATTADSLVKPKPGKKDLINMGKLIKKTIPGKTDSAVAVKKNNPAGTIPVNRDSLLVKKITDTLKNNAAIKKQLTKVSPPKTMMIAGGKPPDKDKTNTKPAGLQDTSRMKTDSIYMSADTIQTQIMTYKDLKVYFEKQRLAHLVDTTVKAKKVKLKESKYLTGARAGLKIDSGYLKPDFFGKPKPVVVKKKPLTKKQLERDSLVKKQLADSVLKAKLAEPDDTARIRIIVAYHHFKMFKSDLQAKADSMFYSTSDSTMRCYVNPIIWTQGSQLSGDTIYMQMKHRKLDNMTMFPHSFIVNIDKGDSVHFNQVAGKRMRGYFKDDKLHRMTIEGNAESIYFSRDSAKNIVNGMQRSLSSVIKANFKHNKVTNMGFYTKPENRYGPLIKFTEDEKVLKGFIWKPKERPVSKESIIPSFNKKKEETKTLPGKDAKGKLLPKRSTGGKVAKDTVLTKPGVMPLQTKRDSILKDSISKLPVLKTKKDSLPQTRPIVMPVIRSGKDTIKTAPVKVAPVQ